MASQFERGFLDMAEGGVTCEPFSMPKQGKNLGNHDSLRYTRTNPGLLLHGLDESAHDPQSQQIRELTGNMASSSSDVCKHCSRLVPLRKPATMMRIDSENA
jgi:hypothetical protein